MTRTALDPLAIAQAPSGRTLSWTIIIAGHILFYVLVMRSPHHFIYDEGVYHETHRLFWEYGLSSNFVSKIPYGPGPTYIIVHALIERLFGLELPALRFVNYALLLALTVMLSCALACGLRRGQEFAPKSNPALIAAVFTVLPTVGVSAGMLLTEMPAAIFVGIFLLSLVCVIGNGPFTVARATAAVVCGLAIGAAILGRPNYLLVLPCLMILPRWQNGMPNREDIVLVAIMVIAATLLIGPVFFIWGGIMPPSAAWMGTGIVPWHGILGAGYAGVITFIVAPDIFRILVLRKISLLVILVVAAVIVWGLGQNTVPMTSVLTSVGMEKYFSVIGFAFSLLIAIIGVSFLFSMANHLYRYRNDRFSLFFTCVSLLGIVANMKVTVQFSSRYVFVFLPFLFMGISNSIRVNWHFPLRLALSGCLSLATLASYYFMS